MQLSVWKIMLKFFEGWTGSHYTALRDREETLTGATNTISPVIRSKRRETLNTGVLLRHYNARTHTAPATFVAIRNLSFFESFLQPPYSKILSTNDFKSLWILKNILKRQVFQKEVHEWPRRSSKDFIRRDIHTLSQHCKIFLFRHWYNIEN